MWNSYACFYLFLFSSWWIIFFKQVYILIEIKTRDFKSKFFYILIECIQGNKSFYIQFSEFISQNIIVLSLSTKLLILPSESPHVHRRRHFVGTNYQPPDLPDTTYYYLATSHLTYQTLSATTIAISHLVYWAPPATTTITDHRGLPDNTCYYHSYRSLGLPGITCCQLPTL